MFCPVECHVFEEVGQTLLGIILLDGSDVVDDVEIGLAFGFFVVTDVVGHSVFEFSRTEFGIGGNRLIHLRRDAADGKRRQCGQ